MAKGNKGGYEKFDTGVIPPRGGSVMPPKDGVIATAGEDLEKGDIVTIKDGIATVHNDKTEVTPSNREYKVVSTGMELPSINLKKDADPMHLKCLRLFEKLQCGSVISPFAINAIEEVEKIITELRDLVSEKK